jgi:hypothetical protein
MDYPILITGCVPPLLAAIAEICNPVSKDSLRAVTEEAARGLAFKPQLGEIIEVSNIKSVISTEDDIVKERERRAGLIAHATRRIATAAVEVAGVVPTWISVTSGIVAVCAERVNPVLLSVVTAIWIASSSIFGMFYFSHIRYWQLGFLTKWKLPFKRKKLIRQERLSLLLVGANFLVMLVALFVASLH